MSDHGKAEINTSEILLQRFISCFMMFQHPTPHCRDVYRDGEW
jgi:hypothetical protein